LYRNRAAAPGYDRGVATPIPDDLFERRRILYARDGGARIQAAAKELLQSGRLAESLEFLERAKDLALLNDARRRAIEAGDAFSLRRAGSLLEAEPTADEWRTLSARAEAKERWFDAVNALERAGDVEKAEELRAARCPDFRPFKPANK
jgi:hypothetical protein